MDGLDFLTHMGNHRPMSFIADLHIHSRFSRATSRSLDALELSYWAARKGISVVGSGDITHPEWIRELGESLTEAEGGLYRLRADLEKPLAEKLPPTCRRPVHFMLSGEISCIYKKNGRTRKLHHLVLLPDFEAAGKLNSRLDRIGNITSDGRPILGLDSKDLLEIVLEVDDRAFFIPAHIWTPWFSLFGSKSGFDSIEECFEDLSGHIHALETGLSSDPPMNRLLSALDCHVLVSNSDAHSASKLGREANLFDTELAYGPMIQAMKDGKGFGGTIEFYPEEGKYHLDGHRKCGLRMEPHETREAGGRCPGCGAPVTVGVLSRVEDLADRDEPVLRHPFFSLIPLCEILSELFSCGPNTKKVSFAYESLLAGVGPELELLMSVPLGEIEEAGGPLLSLAVGRMRENRVIRQGGYDGEYGVIRVFKAAEIHELAGQSRLFGRPEKKTPETPAPRQPGKKKKPAKPSPTPAADRPLEDVLNNEQREAVTHRGGHLLIVAGPGTGKTLTLTHRIARMIGTGGGPHSGILAITFTNKASREMGDRLKQLLPDDLPPGAVRVSTFHRFCLETLREEGPAIGVPGDFRLCSEVDAEELARRALLETPAGGSRVSASRLLSRIPGIRMRLLERRPPAAEDAELLAPFEAYQRLLRDFGMLDLDDLEVETLRLFREHPETCRRLGERHPMIFVDEYQDTSPVQAALLKTMAEAGGCEVTAIGDPDQAVYGFRGADVENFYRFRDDFPGASQIRLLRNYRSARNILKGAAALLGCPPLEGVNGRGGPLATAPCATHREEAEMVVEQIETLLGGTTHFSMDSGRVASGDASGEFGFGDIAVLFRLNAQGDALEEALSRAGIPFSRSGEKPLTASRRVQTLWRFLQAIRHPGNAFYREAYLNLLGEDRAQGERILAAGMPPGRIGDLVGRAAGVHGLAGDCMENPGPLKRLREAADGFDGNLESFVDMLSLDRGIDHTALEGDRVALMSFHASKGLEWPVVFLTGLEDGLVPLGIFGSGNEAEEKRLLYVALTRARVRVVLSLAARRNLQGRTLELPPSRFLRSLPAGLQTPLERTYRGPARGKGRQLSLF